MAASALLRGGVFRDEGCIIGPAVELKTTFMFSGAKAAHLNFIGDSLIGPDVNLEAGSIVANYRNELDDKMIRIRLGDRVIETGVDRFGALIGDGARIGANAVIAPGVTEPGGEGGAAGVGRSMAIGAVIAANGKFCRLRDRLRW